MALTTLLVGVTVSVWNDQKAPSDSIRQPSRQTTYSEGSLSDTSSLKPELSANEKQTALAERHQVTKTKLAQRIEPPVPAFRLISRLTHPVVVKSPFPDDPVPWGDQVVTSSSLIDPASIRSEALLQKGTSLSFPVPEGGWISGKITYREMESTTGRLSIAGQLADRPGHYFSLFRKGAEISAMILLPDERRALLIQQDEAGRLLLQEKPIDTVICQNMPAESQEMDSGSDSAATPASIAVPLLDSRPSATEVLYLDFDGEAVTDALWAGGNTILAAPATIAGSPITQDQIRRVWSMVSENFRPFNVSVTTDASRYSGALAGRRMRCIITPTRTANPGSGGVAYRNSFSSAGISFSATISCWSFNDYTVSDMALTITHELGHTLGLSHDGIEATRNEPAYAYYTGHGSGITSWGPLMGSPFGKALTQWSRGEYLGADNNEDDVALIARTANRFGYASDDIGNTKATARFLDLSMTGTFEEEGLVHQENDVDFFRFHSVGGIFTVACAPSADKPNLNTSLELYDSSDSLVEQSSPAGDLSSNISIRLAPGDYFLKVTAQGEGSPTNDPPTGYSRYGSLGTYKLRRSHATLLDLSSANQHFGITGGERSFEVSSLSGWNWSLDENAPWLISQEASHQNGDQTFTFTVLPNFTSWPRLATLKVASGSLTKVHTIIQDAMVIGGRWEWGRVTAWGDGGRAQASMPDGLGGIVAISGGRQFTLALKANGTVVAWGDGVWLSGLEIPQGLTGVIAIDAGESHCLALKADGTVMAWGEDTAGQTNVPADLNEVMAIATGTRHSLALKRDGTVVQWGQEIPMPEGLSDVVAIAAGSGNSLALKRDGTVVAWGDNSRLTEVPANLRDVIAIAMGESHAVALKVDGTIAQWGAEMTQPNLDGIMEIACGQNHTLALKNDGTVVAWGSNLAGQTRVPTGLKGVTSIAAGAEHSVTLSNSQPFTTYPASRSVMAQGGLRSCALTAIGDWSWSISPGSDWITITSPPNQSGNQILQYTVAPNDLPARRSAAITFTNGIFSTRHFITQEGSGVAGVERPLVILHREVPALRTSLPDTAGILTLIGTPTKSVTKLKQGIEGQFFAIQPGAAVIVTAAVKTGHVFSHWQGVPAGAQVRGSTVAFTMPDHDVPALTATFVTNPFGQPGFAAFRTRPQFQGLLQPDETTAPGNSTVGYLAATLVPTTGSLSGKISMDGLVTTFTGSLYGDGSVWFRSGTIMTSQLPFAGRELAMTWDANELAMTVTGPDTSRSTGRARPPLYSASLPVRRGLLDSKGVKGYYTLALPAVPQTPDMANTACPQGTGQAGLTLLSNGTLNLAVGLAEGTKVTASGYLASGDEMDLFIMLATPGGTTKKGSLTGTLIFDETQADSDVSSQDMRWFRPAAQSKATVTQAYCSGWPEGIALGAVGALYDSTLTVGATLGLGSPAQAGNTRLLVTGGKLAEEMSIPFNLEGNKYLKLNPKDTTWSLTLLTATGMISGTFVPSSTGPAKRAVPFSGVLLSKGTNRGGWGHFLSNQAGDLNPESGSIGLQKLP
ncbi:hypothetical protein BGE01nite_20680 [Brevifollis gellanilyticus]|uniref:Bacterial repeat domain-containing protein n=2 Tax=Brevifollis gellanilyticus TaxID=748831 RepID=A0A512M7S1_9BACT|nr:hypothetical protein BGE01nite_20680 [Brevifollis gellanilyticus]